MYDIGDVVHLTTSWYDSSATPVLVDPSSLTLTITLPDRTIVTPTPVKDSTGKYHYDYTTSQAGRHTVYWLGAGSNGGAYSDAFDVALSSSNFIISLAEAKVQLSKSSLIVTDDEELRLWLGVTTDIVERYIGNVVPKTYTESYDGGGLTIALWHYPVIAVTSMTENMGTSTYTLTNQPVGSAVDGYGYSIDNSNGGIISRRGSASWPIPFMNGEGNIAITYIAGRSTVPYYAQGAARIILQHLWMSRRGGATAIPGVGGGDDQLVPGMGYAIPNMAVEMLNGHQTITGFA